MRLTKKSRLRVFLWSAVALFLLVTATFPRWITLFYPRPHQELVYSMAARYDVDPFLVFAIIRAESKYQTWAESPRGAKGLMQIMPDTAAWIAAQMKIGDFEAEALYDPEMNIRMGCWYLSDIQEEFEGSLPLTAAAYNAGRGKVNQWREAGQWSGSAEDLKDIPFPETREYVKNVLANYRAYHAIYDHGRVGSRQEMVIQILGKT
ncbi:MAG: lytic transglycosylase domain-containing protein [Syntrophomonadaceae bacterium]